MPADSSALNTTVVTLATHALPLYGVLLACVLVVAAGGWWMLHRYAVHRESSRFSSLAYLVGRLVLGFLLIIGAAALFAELSEVLGDGEKAGALDLLFSDTIRATASRSTLQVFAALTHFGDTLTLTTLTVLAAAALLWWRQRWLCAGLLTAVLGNAALNHTLKAIFERTRPIHDNGPVMADGWSFPSGHASGSVVVYGMLAYVVLRLLPVGASNGWRLATVLLAAAIAFTTGCSRVLLQVHFATDVMAGFASGAAWLTVCVISIEFAAYYRSSRASRITG